jgi:hypothetical protein
LSVADLAVQKSHGRLLDVARLVLTGATLLVLMLVEIRNLCISGVYLLLGVLGALGARLTYMLNLSSGIGDLLDPNPLAGFGFLRYAASRG